jgi:hypothetical protein
MDKYDLETGVRQVCRTLGVLQYIGASVSIKVDRN